MNRRQFIKKTGVFAGGLGLLGPTAITKFDSKLIVLHTNDWHSRIEPFPIDGGKYSGLGGAEKRAALIKKIRQENENVLLLDSGDIFQGTPYFNKYGGELEFKLMSAMKYDASTLGNHDFDVGLDGLKKQLPHANFDFVIANYNFSNTILDNVFKPYKIIQKGPFKVGVFGIGIKLNGLVPERLFGKTKYLDPVNMANKTAATLRKEGCNFVVCLSHLGFEYENEKISDVKLAKKLKNVDLILGGHTHTFMDSPAEERDAGGNKVYIHQAGWAGIVLGKLEIFLKSKGLADVNNSSMLKIC